MSSVIKLPYKFTTLFRPRELFGVFFCFFVVMVHFNHFSSMRESENEDGDWQTRPNLTWIKLWSVTSSMNITRATSHVVSNSLFSNEDNNSHNITHLFCFNLIKEPLVAELYNVFFHVCDIFNRYRNWNCSKHWYDIDTMLLQPQVRCLALLPSRRGLQNVKQVQHWHKWQWKSET